MVCSRSDVINHMLGAVDGCRRCAFGNGLYGRAKLITGVSTLAIGSFIAFFGIVLGSALTMKVQFYQMMYEDEASFGKALLTGW